MQFPHEKLMGYQKALFVNFVVNFIEANNTVNFVVN